MEALFADCAIGDEPSLEDVIDDGSAVSGGRQNADKRVIGAAAGFEEEGDSPRAGSMIFESLNLL